MIGCVWGGHQHAVRRQTQNQQPPTSAAQVYTLEPGLDSSKWIPDSGSRAFSWTGPKGRTHKAGVTMIPVGTMNTGRPP